MKRILNTNEFLHGGDYNPEQWWDEPDVINQDFALCWFFFSGSGNVLCLGAICVGR
ncbi:hypothetical protein [Lactobacillus paragasseri]|uniref:hypothetical protein n=1 Tax=Lactobacillus paragasseri TaxID=2107999 RepID=UPI001C68FEEA|nr:hypothetical protein [Lactobacillus paragasseri]